MTSWFSRSKDGPSVAAQVAALRKHGAGKVFREVASGAKTDRVRLRRVLNQLDAGWSKKRLMNSSAASVIVGYRARPLWR